MLKSLHKKALIPQKATLYCNNIVNISQSTTEKIEPQHINDFLRNCISSADQTITINSKLFYTYFEKNNQYEIFFIKNFSNKETILPFIFSQVHDENINELFIYDSSFIVYSKGEFKLFKEISSELSIDDIKNFIVQRYEIVIDKTIKFSTQDIDLLQKQYKIDKGSSLPKLIELKKDKRVLWLFSFTIALLLIPLIHYNFLLTNNDTKYKIDKKITSLEKNYKNLFDKKDKRKTRELINTLLHIKKYHLKFQTINLNKNKIFLSLKSKNKLNLLEFVDTFKGKIEIDKLNFDKSTKKFNMEVSIVI